jgi:predicted SAM-dependent methyltransferase
MKRQLSDYIDLSKYPNLTPEHRIALEEMLNGATDAKVPVWFQAHCEAMFNYIESGCERTEELIAQAYERGNRNPAYDGDMVGDWLDADDYSDYEESA